MPRSEDPEPDLEIPAVPPPSCIRFDAWTLAFMALVLLPAGFALLRFAMRGEDRFVDAAWLASVVALIAGQWRSRRRSPEGGRTHGRAVHLVLLLLLFGIALTSRLYHLTTLPFNLDGASPPSGPAARSRRAGSAGYPLYGWAAIPMIGFMPSALTMRLAGPGLLGLNLAGVIEGLLIIVGVYLLGCELFHPRVGVLAASLLTISYTFLHFSRTSAYIDPVVFTVWALYLLVRALRHGSGLAAVASGGLMALDCEMYYAGRAVVLIAPLVALLVVGRSRRWLVARWRESLLVALAGAVVLGPMLLLFLKDRDSFGTRDAARSHPGAGRRASHDERVRRRDNRRDGPPAGPPHGARVPRGRQQERPVRCPPLLPRSLQRRRDDARDRVCAREVAHAGEQARPPLARHDPRRGMPPDDQCAVLPADRRSRRAGGAPRGRGA